MLVEKITSRQNPLVRRFRRVRDGVERHLVFIEGIKLVEEAITAGVHFESVAFSPAVETSDRGLAVLDSLQHVPCRGAHVPENVMELIASAETPQGIVAIIGRPYYEVAAALKPVPQLIVIADRLQDPGNLGTIIRTAEAAGATGLITTRHTVDPFNYKALRAAMGSAFRLPIVTDLSITETRRICTEAGLSLVGTQPGRGDAAPAIKDAGESDRLQRYCDLDLTQPLALIFGSEGSGIAESTALVADVIAQIPMAANVESLNVSAAAAVLLFEAARQRNFRRPGPKSKKRKASPATGKSPRL
jgi:TrmH family RNA methyltransferase